MGEYMEEQVNAYIEFLARFGVVQKPDMPKFDVSAYTENEYVRAINSIEQDFEFADSINLTEQYLKGE